jgi:phospholipase/carboxylesterase
MESERCLSVIALHGIAVRDEQIEQAMPPVVQYAGTPGVRWLFPRAPRRNIAILGGVSARAWYDISTYDRSRLDEAGIEEATEVVCGAVRAERERDPHRRRVVVMGFSQGGALALNAGLSLQGEVDGIIALATAIPFPGRLSQATSQSPPVFFGHGFLDRCVPYRLGRESQQQLAAKGYKTEWHTYAYGHSTGRRQLRDVSRWLHRNFPTTEPVRVRSSSAVPIRPRLGDVWQFGRSSPW